MAEGGSGQRDGAATRSKDSQTGGVPSSERKYSLPRRVRLLRTADYRKVYAEGRRRNLGLLVAFARTTGEQTSRVGMTVPRAFGGAVERNRMKRRLREVVRKHRSELGPGWDIVLHPRAEAKTAKLADLEATVQNFFAACAQSSSSSGRSDSRRTANS